MKGATKQSPVVHSFLLFYAIINIYRMCDHRIHTERCHKFVEILNYSHNWQHASRIQGTQLCTVSQTQKNRGVGNSGDVERVSSQKEERVFWQSSNLIVFHLPLFYIPRRTYQIYVRRLASSLFFLSSRRFSVVLAEPELPPLKTALQSRLTVGLTGWSLNEEE